MRVFIAGATGVLGRRLVTACTDRGHDVIGLTRDQRGDEIVEARGGTPHRGDVLDAESLIEGAADADVLVHAATAIPTETNPSEADWARNDRIRRQGASNLVATAPEVGAQRVLLQSVVWLARQEDGSAFDETATPNPDRSTQSALDAERIVREGAEKHDFEPVILRGGYFYAPDTAHTRQFGEGLLSRRLPIIARGLLGRQDATLSFVHADDAARAFATAAEGSATGIFHVVDDEPVTWATFLQAIADRLDAPTPFRLPAWLAGLFVGDNVIRLLTRPMATNNERFRDAFDWEPRYPSYREGLEQVLERWRETGVIRMDGDSTEWVGE